MNCVVLYIIIDDDKGGYDIKLLEFFANIKNMIFVFWFFVWKFEPKRFIICCVWCWALDTKNCTLCFSFVSKKKGILVINGCDWKIICTMLFENVMNNSIVFQMCHMILNLFKWKRLLAITWTSLRWHHVIVSLWRNV
jgi:hypothetical protein